MSLERHQHTDRGRDGRYTKSEACDGCGKPVGTNYFTDTDVCGNTDGPGFYICERKRCQRRLDGLDVEARRSIYVATRAGAKATAKPPVHHSCEVERTKKVLRLFSLNLRTGEESKGHDEVRTEPCGGPLWTDEERKTGVCRSCRVGWTHPDNYPTERGAALIKGAVG